MAENSNYATVGYYTNVDDLLTAAKRVRDAGFTKWDTHTPFPVHGIDGAMGIKQTFLPWITLCMGLTGMVVGVAGQWWVNAQGYDFLISGKPTWSLPANIPVAFEVIIAFSAFTTFFGMLALNRLPRLSHPLHRLAGFARVTADRFAVVVETRDPRYDEGQVKALLATDAEAVEHCPADPTRAALPMWLHGLAAIATCITLIPLAIAYKGRQATSEKPRYHVWFDMDFQRKAKTQTAFTFFGNEMAMRKPVDGTIAVGGLKEDHELHYGVQPGSELPTGMEVDATTGVPNAEWTTGFPAALVVDDALLDRGRQRYDIYCSVCHGVRGDGLGSVALRAKDLRASRWGWIDPKNLLASATRDRSNGELFHIAGHGISTMKGYAAQIKTRDRWAIVSWLRALQETQAIDERVAPEADYQDMPEAIRDAVVVVPADDEGK